MKMEIRFRKQLDAYWKHFGRSYWHLRAKKGRKDIQILLQKGAPLRRVLKSMMLDFRLSRWMVTPIS